MAGSILGPDQVRKINDSFPKLVAHIRSLLDVDHTAVGLMKVHCMVESFDSDAMALLFRELSFISPFEKKALVRAAIYEIMAEAPQIFVSSHVTYLTSAPVMTEPAPATFYTPPQHHLNVATTGENVIAPKVENPSVNQAVDKHTSTVQRQFKDVKPEDHKKLGADTLKQVSADEDAKTKSNKLVNRSPRKPKV